MKTNDDLQMIIPVGFGPFFSTVEKTVEDILAHHEKYGFTDFALCGPLAGWRSLHYPPTSHFRELAEMFRAVKERLAPHGIRCGWWYATTVKAGRSPEFAPMIRADGSETPFSSCPLDPAFRERFADNAALFCEIAKPAFMFLEDDYAISASTFSNGCYCPLHLAEFAKRTGKTFTRETLLEALAAKGEESRALNRAWKKLICDTMVGISEALRAAVDRKSPEIPIGLMESGQAVDDGDFTVPVCRALAGPRHTPTARICGTYYGGFDTGTLAETLYHPMWRIESIPQPFYFLHESDTFPHTRFFTAGNQMRALMGAVYSFGYEGSVFQTQQYLDDPNEEVGFGGMFAKERKRFFAVSRIARKCRLHGVGLPNDAAVGDRVPDFVRALSYFGIPSTSRDAKIAFWDGVQAGYLDDETVRKQLAKGLFLDGNGAKALCDRGYGRYIGVSVGGNAVTGRQLYDLGAREVIREGFAPDSVGRWMVGAHILANGNGHLLTLTPTGAGCEIVSDAVDFQGNVIAPAMTFFKNELGGSVVVYGTTAEGNFSQSLLNYRRQKLFDDLLIRCGADFCFVRNAPKIYLIENRPKEKEDFAAMLTAINLCEDELPLTLHLPDDLRGRTPYKIARDGSLRRVAFEKTDDGIAVTDQLPFLDPLYLVFR